MSEWYKNHEQHCSNFHKLLQERIKQANLHRKLTFEETA
jgi:hypothetical protein